MKYDNGDKVECNFYGWQKLTYRYWCNIKKKHVVSDSAGEIYFCKDDDVRVVRKEPTREDIRKMHEEINRAIDPYL